MINGKFFTGLPPKMIDRVGSGKNRLESHLFWPDDSNAISACAKSKNLQQDRTETTEIQRPIAMVQQDMDTRKMFHKEFEKSSIQFYDNLQEQREPNRSLIRPQLSKQRIALKPTATRPELPESVVDEDSTNTRKLQAFTSKIEFNDCMDKNFNNMSRHHNREPKMDINVKIELDRNTKNSPKLQNKSNVRNLRTDEVDRFNNDCVSKSVDDERNSMKNQACEDVRGNRYIDVGNTCTFYKKSNSGSENFASRNSYYYNDEPKLNYIEKNMKNMTVRPIARQNITYQNDYFDDYHSDMNNGRFYEEPRTWVRSQHQKKQERRRIFSNDARHKENEYQYKDTFQISPTSTSDNYTVGVPKHNKNMRIPKAAPNTSPVSEITACLLRSSALNFSSPESAAGVELQPPNNQYYMNPPTKATARDAVPTDRSRYARNSAVQRVSVGLPD